MVAVVIGLVVPAVGSTLGGTVLWRWARDSFPGGGYGFAVAVGALIPVTFMAGAISVGTMNRAAGRARSVLRAVAAVLSFALLMLLGTACVEMMGPSPKHHDRTGGWAYEHYAWIWAVALLAALVTGALLVTALVLRTRGRAKRDGSTATGERVLVQMRGPSQHQTYRTDMSDLSRRSGHAVHTVHVGRPGRRAVRPHPQAVDPTGETPCVSAPLSPPRSPPQPP
ncbi:hypothetical protein OG978_35325 [Streptomyces sp. NBC_01591]|uniref:hypothetical protein n=1 Tax=Streptomyces sp. NBC_01591 TaxID=2975888 RepID=UPI002DD94BA9|nr:hypothetical protein [Streptomyces sp. NBC_01591]WSD72207.1 hypothetical protein OG978_35325 [Streptomyces sp. NBC_01591]